MSHTESCRTNQYVMSYIYQCDYLCELGEVARVENESCRVMSHNESCRTYQYVMSHIYQCDYLRELGEVARIADVKERLPIDRHYTLPNAQQLRMHCRAIRLHSVIHAPCHI